MESPATTEGGSRAEQIDSVGPHPPFPSPDLGAVASSSAGGSFAPSLLLLGIVTLFLLAAPRVPPRLLADAGGHWPAAFACALERPG
jgi:hypothetical protein